MSRYTVLVSCPLITDVIDEYEDTFDERGIDYDVVEVEQELSESELFDIIDDYDAILAGDDELTADVLDYAERLKLISQWGIGTDHIDLEAAEDLDIEVRNTPDAFGTAVAETVLGYAITLARKLHTVDSRIRDGEWYAPRGRSLHGNTLGVVGVGNIGSTVVRRAAALGMDVVAYDIVPLSDELKEETGVERVDKDELFERSDFVALHCPLTPDTKQFVGAEELDALGSDGYLINASRGEVVDEAKLVSALEDGRIAGAALDVYEEEPLPADHELCDFENVLLGSHNAQNTESAVADVNDRAVENLVSFFADSE